MLYETYTHMVQPYAYGTEKHTIRVRYEIRVRYTTDRRLFANPGL